MKLDVLAVAPHPDDAEIAMGGTLAKLHAEGLKVGILDLTNGEPTPHGSPETRARETAAASEALQIDWRGNLGLPNRSLEADLAARHKLAAVFRQTKPRLLFAPYWIDAHPDHVAGCQLVEAARFWSKLTKSDIPGEPHYPQRIYHYFSLHLKIVPQPAFIVDISDQWQQKLAAVASYQSQFITGRPPGFLERYAVVAANWGRLIGTAYGEPFTSREPLGLVHLRDLI